MITTMIVFMLEQWYDYIDINSDSIQRILKLLTQIYILLITRLFFFYCCVHWVYNIYKSHCMAMIHTAFVSFILFDTITVTFLQSFDHSYNQKTTRGHAFTSICKSVINFLIFDAVDRFFNFIFFCVSFPVCELCIWSMFFSLLITTGTWRTQALYILLLSYWLLNV